MAVGAGTVIFGWVVTEWGGGERRWQLRAGGRGDGGAGCPWGAANRVSVLGWGRGRQRGLGGGREHRLAGCTAAPRSVGTPVEMLPQEWGWGLGALLEPPPPTVHPRMGVTPPWGWLLLPDLARGSFPVSVLHGVWGGGWSRAATASSGHVTSLVRVALGGSRGDPGVLGSTAGSCQQWLLRTGLLAGPGGLLGGLQAGCDRAGGTQQEGPPGAGAGDRRAQLGDSSAPSR